jgi:hypothetical protein
MGELPPAPGAILCEFRGEDGSRQRAAPAVKSTSAALDRTRAAAALLYYRNPDSASQLAADEGTRQHKRRAPKAVYDEMNQLQRSAQSSPLPPHGDGDITRVLYPKVLDDSLLQPNRHSSKGNKGILPHPRHLLHGHLLRGFCQDVLKASSLACHSITHPAAPVRRQASGKLAPPDPIQLNSRSAQVISINLSIYLSIYLSNTHTHTHTHTHRKYLSIYL